MSLAEEIKRVLLENPNILVEVLVSRPEIIYQALAKLTPWQNLTTKHDIEELRKYVDGKFEELRKEVQEVKKYVDDKVQEMKNVIATKEGVEELRREVEDVRNRMATKEEVQELRKEVQMIKDTMATKRDVEELRRYVDNQIKFLSIKLDALGARWGVVNEDAFRNGVREILRDAGYTVEKWLYYDADGYVYGYPSEIELDVIVKDNITMIVEISSAIRRSDLIIIKRKAELYMKATGRTVDRILAITPYIGDKNPDYVRVMAERMGGIKVITPEGMAGQGG
uniref:PD-(D/E)XK nuclease family protein n=1 Tax=Vulcanisaeta distributa TaxID=164451 RepID=UPI000B12835B